ncbi:tetratricopeptide repeat protein [Thermodesulfobacteriota bacterium]
MRKAIAGVIIYMLLTAFTAWGQDAMQFYDLGLKSSMTKRKIDYFTRALELDPNLSVAYEKRGMLYYFQENYPETIQDFQKVAFLKPFNSETYVMLGLAFMKQGDLDEAIANLSRAIELDAQGAGAYSHRSEVFRLNGMIEKAIQDSTRAIKLGGSGPIIGRAFTTRSKAYRELGQNGLADADFKKALKLDPDYYMYNMLTSTELLANWAAESSSLKSVGWMGVALIVSLVFVVIFKLALSVPRKDDDT